MPRFLPTLKIFVFLLVSPLFSFLLFHISSYILHTKISLRLPTGIYCHCFIDEYQKLLSLAPRHSKNLISAHFSGLKVQQFSFSVQKNKHWLLSCLLLSNPVPSALFDLPFSGRLHTGPWFYLFHFLVSILSFELSSQPHRHECEEHKAYLKKKLGIWCW